MVENQAEEMTQAVEGAMQRHFEKDTIEVVLLLTNEVKQLTGAVDKNTNRVSSMETSVHGTFEKDGILTRLALVEERVATNSKILYAVLGTIGTTFIVQIIGLVFWYIQNHSASN
jgi:hypothetical protein